MNAYTFPLAALLVAALTLPAVAQSPDATVAESDAAEAPPASLSANEMQQLLAGRGMGMGRPAAMHGYPGPMHVLRQAEQLELDDDQIARTGALRQRVHARSRELGRQIIDAERALDALLAVKPVDRDALRATLGRIGELRAELRAAHLAAHLDQAAILTEAQLAAIESPPARGAGQGRAHRGGQGMHGGGSEAGCNCRRQGGHGGNRGEAAGTD